MRLQVNRVFFSGNATRDAETQFVNDKPVIWFTIAQGKEPNNLFLSVSYFMNEKETFEIKKGDNVFVEGYLKQWVNKSDSRITDIKATRVANLSATNQRNEQGD